MVSMTLQKTTFHSSDGTRLNGVYAIPDSPKRVVFICHGLGEHCRRYDHVIEALTNAGAAVYACDLRGHGRSDGRRGHIERWRQYVDDVASMFSTAEKDGLADAPWLLLGHSMGGLVAVHAARHHGKRLSALALSGPLLGIAVRVPPVKAAAGKLMSTVWPKLTLDNELQTAYISRDPDTVRAYEQDPLVHSKVSARWFTEMNKALQQAHHCAPALSLPLWLGHGAADKITDPEGSRRFLRQYGGMAESHFFDGLYHEIFNELQPDRDKVINNLVDWSNRYSTPT